MTVLPSPSKVAKTKHHPALPYQQIAEFVEKLRQMDCLSALALEFTILTAARTEETLAAKRNEIKDELWTVPAERMKAGKEQRVPLVPRVLEILKISKDLDPDSEYLFSRNGRRLSNMAMLALVKGMGYKITVHGFRATFRTWSEEETMHHDSLAKKALAHTIKDKVDEAYNRGDLLKKRLKLMQDWSKFCGSVPLKNVNHLKAA
jgi:integrase